MKIKQSIKIRTRRGPWLALLLCLMCSFGIMAQSPTVSVDVKNASVKELLQAIEAKTNYTFAYADADLPTEKVTVKAENKSVQSIIAQALPGMKMEMKGTKIVLTPAAKGQASEASHRVSGTVVDEQGEPLIGASVAVKGTSNAVNTDLDGNYTLEVKGAATLIVTYVGYNPQEVKVAAGQNVANVEMATSYNNLEDVVVVGYGVQNKRDVTTSISSIKSEDFATMPTPDFREAMAAKMPGVQVLNLGGSPEGNVSVRIRGIQSATSGNDPLYVIDGVTCDARAFANLESSDIESLEVLKDASAAAIYGSRGSCGVVIVTTKRGKSEKPLISYDGMVGFSNVSKKIDMLNAYEFANLYAEAHNGCLITQVKDASIDMPSAQRPQTYQRIDPVIEAYLQDKTGTLTDTDWQDEIFRTAITTKHNVSISGSNTYMNYYAGLNYLYREGTIINSDFERFGARVNLDGKRGNFKWGINLSPSYSVTNNVDADSQYGGDGVIASALMAAPIFPVYNADGGYNWDMNGLLRVQTWDGQLNEVLNPVALAKEITDKRKKTNIMGNAYAAYEFIKGLEYRITFGTDIYNYQRQYYRPSYLPLRGYKYLDDPSQPTATADTRNYYHWTLSNQLSFNRTFGDHRVNAVAVYEAEKQTINTMILTGKGTVGDDKIRTTKGVTIDPDSSYDNNYGYTFASWLVRAQYSYKGTYMLSFSIRGDGSSRFAPDTRWGYFPAASIGWRLSEEKFLRDQTWINDLKLRASVGQTGNAQIGNSEYLALYSMSTIDLGSGLSPMYYPSKLANNSLGWEKNTQWNVGLDANLWNGYLGLSADFYLSNTSNMLFDVPVSQVSGVDTSKINIGSMQNKGIELNVTSRHSYGDFNYAFAANWSLNRNKVTALGDNNADIIKNSSYSGGYYLTRVGQPVGCYYLMVQDGIFHNQEELDSYPHFAETEVGDFRFVDVNGNGIIEADEDRAIVGNYMPDFYYGFSLNLGYKGFDLAANFQGVYGNEILNLERRYLLNNEASSNMMRESLERYPYGNLNRATRKSTGRNGACTSTFHLEDGSYLRLQNLSIGYTVPQSITKKLGINKLRVYLQGNNLFTWTKYSGYNPEVNKRADDALTPGEDYCSYPLSRSFSFGLNFNL
ncbi:MAG: SusC/RagA family TonB-linked outer membrane protein [Clostridium sp.]|nr:SusC/RagA family TonB-linked outer membrane protein [Clostridium sp.]